MTNHEESFDEPERWAPVPSEPGYEASTHGRIRSVDRIVVQKSGRRLRLRGQVLVSLPLPAGYRQVATAGRSRRYVHRMVLEAFVGPCPPGMEACHRNCDNQDNRLSNLRWDTPRGNALDTLRMGRHKRQQVTHCPRAHELAPPNLVAAEMRRSHRKCKACDRAASRVRSSGDWQNFQAVSDACYSQILKEVAPMRDETPKDAA